MKALKDEKLWLKIAIALFVAVFSCCVLANVIPKGNMVTKTVASLEKSRDSVVEFSGATIGVSLTLSALPNDFATPLANTLSDMNKYLVLILSVIFLERLIVIEGTKIAFAFLIPIACAVFIVGQIFQKKRLANLGVKICVFGLALVLVIPCSVGVTNLIAADYLEYVDNTIEETKNSSDKISEKVAPENQEESILDKITNAFDTTVSGASNLMANFDVIVKKCINSIAIMVLTSIIMPLLTMLLFKWLLTELFGQIFSANSTASCSEKRSKGE